MKSALFCISLLVLSGQAFAADLNYDCGDYTVTLSDNNTKLSFGNPGGEWGGDYKVIPSEPAMFKALKDVDSDLGAHLIFVSKSMLAGEKSGSIKLQGGEDGNNGKGIPPYKCERDDS